MQGYRFSDVIEILQGHCLVKHADPEIESLLTDSRKLLIPEGTLFFAISSPNRDANRFIPELYAKGVRCFVTDQHFQQADYLKWPEACILRVDNVLQALQGLSAYHRHRFSCEVAGITGSNGKTIVKEWLYQLLSDDEQVLQSPKSYNSQVGVPLSVWQMNESHKLCLFEAGISQRNEMQALQKIIDPQIGILTCIGEAHAKGFQSREEKTFEKLELFVNSRKLVYGSDDKELDACVKTFIKTKNPSLSVFTWGKENADLIVESIGIEHTRSRISLRYRDVAFSVVIPFTDSAAVSNAISCMSFMLCRNIPVMQFAPKMEMLRAMEMRMEMKQGINNCSIINDSYSADINSLSVALDFLYQQKQHKRKTVILSDFPDSGEEAGAYYQKIAAILAAKKPYCFIGIGSLISSYASCFHSFEQMFFFKDTEAFLEALPSFEWRDQAILLKGARVFRFEKISHALQQKTHDTILEIGLHALRHNLNVYRKYLKPQTRIMAMVKAFSYGSGSHEIAALLQHAGVDYLAVAYADEGMELRKAGITLPIMVMSVEEAGFEQLVKYDLEPEVYSFSILHSFQQYLLHNGISNYPVHIKLDTGMHRLGFLESDMHQLASLLASMKTFTVKSVFSHLAASDQAIHDDFTRQQADCFNRMSGMIEEAIGYSFIRHLSNSGAISRLPELQYDMVRLGIGLYGVDSDPFVQQQLQPVTTLKTTISQIKKIPAGDSIGYGRKTFAEREMTIAVVRIGYADGYPRSLGNGNGKMLIQGMLAPVVGSVCMDMTMLDITGLQVEENDAVVVFGEFLPVRLVADWAQTIPYEILTGISQRVRRVYFEE